MDLEFQLGKRGDGRARRSEEGTSRILVLADLGARQSRGLVEVGDPLAGRPLARVRQAGDGPGGGLDVALAAVAPRLALPAAVAGAARALELSALDDFHPDTLFRRLSIFRDPPRAPAPAPAGVVSVGAGDADDVARLLGRRPEASVATAKEPSVVDDLIGQILAKHAATAARPEAPLDAVALGGIMRAVLHEPAFQALEASWRGLDLLVSRAEEEVEIWLLDVSRVELAADLLPGGAAAENQSAAAEEVAASGFARRLLAPPGGRPFAALVSDFAFGPGADDVALLGRIGSLAARLGAPFLASAAPALVGSRALAAAADPARWDPLSPEETRRWQELRRSPAAPFIGLALPRFLARAPYGARTGSIDAFAFEELPQDRRPEAAELCWAGAAFLCALELEEIDDLPFFSFRAQGEVEMYPIAEVLWGQRAADAALARGLMPMVGARDRNVVRVVRRQSIADPPRALDDWGA
jgi:type VI secretion system protein ImpC